MLASKQPAAACCCCRTIRLCQPPQPTLHSSLSAPCPRCRRGKGRGRGKGGASAAAAPGSQDDPYYQKRKSSGGPKYKEDSDEEFSTDEEDLLPGGRCSLCRAGSCMGACRARAGRLHTLQMRRVLQPPMPDYFACLAPCLGAAAGTKVRHQAPAATYARHFARLLENQGSWEPARWQAAGGHAAPCKPPTAEAWEGLGQHAPELAEVAVAAADVASSLQYFEVSVWFQSAAAACWEAGVFSWPVGSWAASDYSSTATVGWKGEMCVPTNNCAAPAAISNSQAAPGGAASQVSETADAVARLSTMLVSAAGLVATHGEGLTQQQRQACCLDAAAAVKQEPLAAAAMSALPPQGLVLAGQPPAAAALPFAMPPQQPGAAQLPGLQLQQPAAMFAQQQQQQMQQQVGLQIGGGMAQPVAGWPGMQLPFANGQQQQQLVQQPIAGMQQAFGMQPLMQQPMQQQFAGMLPQQQWAMPGLALPPSTTGGMPLAPGVTGASVQHYMQLMQQKPGGQPQQPQANGTQH